MRKIVEYNICCEESRMKLVQAVSRAIRDGFEPIGGVAIENGRAMQAVVKYESTHFDSNVVGGYEQTR